MSEQLPNHERLTIASMARDITLHFGEHVPEPGTDETRIESAWEGQDTEGNLWFVKLVTNNLRGDYYSLNLRKADTSDGYQRYRFNRANNKFTYESPPGTATDLDETTAAQNMLSWLVSRPLIDNIEYDAEGHELQNDREFEGIGATIAIDEVRTSAEGAELLAQLAAAQSPTKAVELHEAFYQLTKQAKNLFSVGRTATRKALEPHINAARPKQLPAGPSELPTL